MSLGDYVIILLFTVQGCALAAFLVNATITRRRYRRLKARVQRLEMVQQQIAPLTAAVAQLQQQMAAILPMYLSLRQPSPRRSSTAKMRAIQQAEEVEQEERAISQDQTQRLRRWTQPLEPEQ